MARGAMYRLRVVLATVLSGVCVVGLMLTLTYCTEQPRSHFDLTLALKATTTKLHMGDAVTVTLFITNTGRIEVVEAYCSLRGWFQDGTPQDYSEPILEPAYQNFERKFLQPGEIEICTFALRAVHTGTVWLEGGFGGDAYFSFGDESPVGEYSPRLRLDVEPVNP